MLLEWIEERSAEEKRISRLNFSKHFRSTENSIMRTTDKQYDTNEDLLPTATDDDHYNLKTENNPSPIKISINSPEKKSKNLVESIEAKPVQDVKSAIFIQKDEEVKSVREDDQNSKVIIINSAFRI